MRLSLGRGVPRTDIEGLLHLHNRENRQKSALGRLNPTSLFTKGNMTERAKTGAKNWAAMSSHAIKAIKSAWHLPRRLIRKVTTNPFLFPTIRMVNHKVRHLARSPFKGLPFDQQKHDAYMSWTPAETRYVIFFTPRSGSSRLTDLLTSSKRLGRPEELFNPAFIPGIATTYSARNIKELVALLLRGHTSGRVFGSEVTFNHIFFGFLTGGRFLSAVKPTSTIWLIREDIVAQAVSVSRMIQTNVAHSVQGDGADRQVAEDLFHYHPKQIRSAIARIRWMETNTEKVIGRHRLAPLRLSYEQCVGQSEGDLVQQIAQHVGVDMPPSETRAGHAPTCVRKQEPGDC